MNTRHMDKLIDTFGSRQKVEEAAQKIEQQVDAAYRAGEQALLGVNLIGEGPKMYEIQAVVTWAILEAIAEEL